MKKNEFIVLGHTGFIGSKVFNQLKSINIPVCGVSSKEINFLDPKSPEKLKLLLKSRTTLIIATALTRESGDNLETLNKNIEIVSNIATAIEKKKIKKCVYLSSCDVYGIPERLPITENIPTRPKSYYAIAKVCCESILEATCRNCYIPFVVLRYNGVFGPGQRNIGYGPNYFITSIKRDHIVKIWGDGKELRDTLYIRDLARIIVKLSINKTVGIYNIAKGESLSFIKMIEIIKSVLGENFKTEKRKRNSSSFDQVFDITKLKKILPDFKFTPFKTALEETCNELT